MSELQNSLENKKFSIFHIEDQYNDMRWIANDVRNWLLRRVLDEDDDAIVNLTSNDVELECGHSCVCYSLTIDGISGFSIAYFFTDSPRLPPELRKYVESNRLFLLDVLRPNSDGVLEASIEESYGSIQGYSKAEDVICYTAYQGEDVEADFAKQEIKAGDDVLKLIQKSEFEQLEEHLLVKLDEWLDS